MSRDPSGPPESDSRLVCFCHHVRETAIREAFQAGAMTLEAIQDETQASTGCGGCEFDVRELLEEMLEAEKAKQPVG